MRPRRLPQPAPPPVRRGGLPGAPKPGARAVAMEPVGALRRHADAPARLQHAAAFGERAEKGELPRGRPPVAPVAQRNDGERERGGGRIGGVSHV